MQNSNKKGFTLLELLIVIGIIAILSVVVIIVLNPAETLRKSRDTQRMSDLATMKTAIALYMTVVSVDPQLDGNSGTPQTKCDGGVAADEELWVSVYSDAEAITDIDPPPGFIQNVGRWQQALAADANLTDGAGWLPVNLDAITGGSPISNFPVDPVNDLSVTTGDDTSAANAITNGALMYRYACKKHPLAFEINARLESDMYGVGGTDPKGARDGGNNTSLFEVGTMLSILPASNDF